MQCKSPRGQRTRGPANRVRELDAPRERARCGRFPAVAGLPQQTQVVARCRSPLSTDTSATDTDEGRVYVVEQYIESQAAMHALAAEYAANSLQRGEPAILVSAQIAGSGR